MSLRSCRVHVCTYEDGNMVGQLLPRSSALLDRSPPTAYGSDEETLLAELEVELSSWLARADRDGHEPLEPFLWDETLEPHLLRLDIPLLTATKKQQVLGKRKVPLRVTYFHAALQAGGFRLLAPRFGVELRVWRQQLPRHARGVHRQRATCGRAADPSARAVLVRGERG